MCVFVIRLFCVWTLYGFNDLIIVHKHFICRVCRLPLPWLMYGAVNGGAAYRVNSTGLLCSIVLLFVMLVAVIATIAVCRWRMSKLLGLTMLVLYVVFIVLSVLLEMEIIKCPV